MNKINVFIYTAIMYGSAVAKDSQEYDIGGVRQAKAVIAKNEHGYHCSISFIPVRCFDVSSNRKINQRKSVHYATRALTLFVSEQGTNTSTIEHLKLTKNEGVKNGRAIFQYSASGISAVTNSTSQRGDSEEPSTIIKKTVGDSPTVIDKPHKHTLLSSLDDYQSTLHILEECLTSDITAINRENLEESVASLEEYGFKTFEQLTVKIESEKFLLSTEKSQLIHTVELSKVKFIKQLSEAYKIMNETSSSSS